MAITGPSEAGFLAFIRGVMRINSTILPDDDPVIPIAYEVAIALVNQQINSAVPAMYTLAVYNLGGSNILNYANDQDDAAPVEGSNPPTPYFAWTRAVLHINSFVPGVIQSTADESTSESLLNPEVMKNLQLADLQYLKDLYGRRYLSIASQVGTLWGLS